MHSFRNDKIHVMNIRLIIIVVLSAFLALSHPLSAQTVQKEHNNGKSKAKESPMAEISGFILEYNPILKKLDTFNLDNSNNVLLRASQFNIREKKTPARKNQNMAEEPIFVFSCCPPYYRIVKPGEKSIKATDYNFSLLGYECLSPDIFPFSKDPDHTDVVFIRKNNMLFYEKIGNATAKKLNTFCKKTDDRTVDLRAALSTKVYFDPGSIFLVINDENGNLRKTNSIVSRNESFVLVIEMYTCDNEDELFYQRKEFIKNQVVDVIFPDIPRERIEYSYYTLECDDKSNIGNGSYVFFRTVKHN